jgi:hypothetical protein
MRYRVNSPWPVQGGAAVIPGNTIIDTTQTPSMAGKHFQVDVERKKNGTQWGVCPWCGHLASDRCCPEYQAYLVEPVPKPYRRY